MYEALQYQGQADNSEDEVLSWSLSRTRQSASWITTLGVKKERRVTVGDSLCRETEGPMCQLDIFHRQVCCLLGTWVRDSIRRLPGLIEPSDYYPLVVVVHVGFWKVDERSLMAVKKSFKALGQQMEGTGAQLVFSSVPLVAGRNTERNRTHLINIWVKGRQRSFGFCHDGTAYMAPGLLETNGFCLSKSPWVCWDDWEDLKLGLKEEGDKTRLGRDEPGCNLELQCWGWNQ